MLGGQKKKTGIENQEKESQTKNEIKPNNKIEQKKPALNASRPDVSSSVIPSEKESSTKTGEKTDDKETVKVQDINPATPNESSIAPELMASHDINVKNKESDGSSKKQASPKGSAKKKKGDAKARVNEISEEVKKPIDTVQQKQQEIQSSISTMSSKVNQPVQNLQSKQQEAQSAINSATAKVNAARLAVDMKDKSFSSVISDSTSSLSGVQGSLNNAKLNIEQKQQEFSRGSDLVKQIREKIALAKGVTGKIPGGNI